MIPFVIMREEFEKCLKRVNLYLVFLGLSLDNTDDKKSILQRLRNHPIYCTHLISLNAEVIAELLWLVEAIITEKTFLEITYFLPCLTLCILSNFKSFTFLYYAHHINELVNDITLLLNRNSTNEERDIYVKKLTAEHVSMLISITSKIGYLIILGLSMFAVGPLFIILPHYYKTGEVKLEMPFIVYYPFNEFAPWIYPFIYIHQVWTGMKLFLLLF